MKQITRTTYMQSLMQSTYSLVAIEAIQSGTISLAWEKVIARQLVRDAQADKSEAVLILESCNGDVMEAAKLVTGSIPPEIPPLVSKHTMIIDNETITL